ncbi:hypothetical protein SAMN05444483_10632 [Salegentibacter echinorum]|uniref:Secreted protein n=1 Tax=Salegentibacter echinorum TaxID=1073325 RepID=A0A1M5HWT7_SALEC|nr:hypothetical protein [Salegentibacter echinorum]SHG20332.1 hypothetical protein SAMN05444483_10632 [Salegentibacter echinorum]
MKLILSMLFFCFSLSGIAQIEIPRTNNTGGILKLEPEEKGSGFPILRREESSEENKYLREKPKKLDFRETPHNMKTAGDAIKEKWTADKEAKNISKEDQYLGDFKTKGKFVELYARDHQFVDGDQVNVYVNGKFIERVVLGGSFHPILVTLESGFNNIEFEAINQGSSGPNTAQLKVIEENGNLVVAKEWNLLTGARASLIVVKE